MLLGKRDWKGQIALSGLLLFCSLSFGLGLTGLGAGVAFAQEDALFRLIKGELADAGAVPAIAGVRETTQPVPVVHVVAKGETLYGIARSYGLPVAHLVAANRLGDGNLLQPGQPLVITTGRVVRGPEDKSDALRKMFPSRGAVLFSMQTPLTGVLTSAFGPRGKTTHHGIDIAGDQGEIIQAAQTGKVVFIGVKPVYGNTVILEHPHGVRTLYAHASQILVRDGNVVSKGQAIARVGASGVTTGPHLHFEVHVDRVAVDPLVYFKQKT
ncbi:MAG: LysM peptidoglycan-binding domain-containing M23 family metallopeptidase [Heliobacteriaceae bacterium]|nr:LysM peptidoglycan-binding domain-containing M23 family metallopeptidase [Heliobacteriaceae bacterium]MDD4587943.1 LysM peptidoglycan-binding domain-containing M23 family metallopeptidase [Heliobacteriaceae bacterium]